MPKNYDNCYCEPTQIRFLHNVVGGPNVDVYVGHKKLVSNLSFGELTSYLEVKNGKLPIIIKAKDTVVIEQIVRLDYDKIYTVIIGGSLDLLGSLRLFIFNDKKSCAPQGSSCFRFIHNVFGAPNVDVYINDTLYFSNVEYGQATDYKSIKLGETAPLLPPPGNVRQVNIYVAGTQTPVTSPIPIFPSSGGNYSLFAIGNLSNIGAIFSYDNEDKCITACEVLQQNFDIQCYMGKWHLIASIPQFYDQGCEKQTAEYTFLSNNIKVFNTCYDRNNNIIRTITGSATAPSPCNPASLIVFFDQPFNPTSPNYLIHKTDYVNYAVVGSPNRESFYILSRSSQITERQYRKFLSYARKLGYNTNLIVPTYDSIIY